MDITDRLLPTPESLVSEATRKSLRDLKKFLGEHAPRPPSLKKLMSAIIFPATEKKTLAVLLCIVQGWIQDFQ